MSLYCFTAMSWPSKLSGPSKKATRSCPITWSPGNTHGYMVHGSSFYLIGYLWWRWWMGWEVLGHLNSLDADAESRKPIREYTVKFKKIWFFATIWWHRSVGSVITKLTPSVGPQLIVYLSTAISLHDRKKQKVIQKNPNCGFCRMDWISKFKTPARWFLSHCLSSYNL